MVDDGSTDSTEQVVAQASKDSAIPVRYFRQENKGPAAARNVGIREAKSELILFTDDDIIPSPDLVGEHLKWQSKYPGEKTAVLGVCHLGAGNQPNSFHEMVRSGALVRLRGNRGPHRDRQPILLHLQYQPDSEFLGEKRWIRRGF